jgi:hypothetical protein
LTRAPASTWSAPEAKEEAEDYGKRHLLELNPSLLEFKLLLAPPQNQRTLQAKA